MRNASGQQTAASKVKMSGSEKIANRNPSNKIFGEHIRYFLSIKCLTRKFHVVVVQSNGKEMYKKVCFTCRVVFLLLLIRLLIFLQFSLPSPFSIARFYLLFEYILSILTRASLLALAKSIYYSCLFSLLIC